MSFSYEYPRPSLTVDIVLFARTEHGFAVLLIQRGRNPFAGSWAFPGGFVDMDEDLETAARRELREETGLDSVELEQLLTAGKPGRDPRGHTVSVIFWGVVEHCVPAAADDAADARWFLLADLPNPIAFDHEEILAAAVKKLRCREPAALPLPDDLVDSLFHRSTALLGRSFMETLALTRVIIFGVGGVGSWCAEALVRSGIGHITLVDSDRVCITNVNRQLPALATTVGQVKVDVLRRRLREINPRAEVVALQQIYEAATSDDFALPSYDVIVDAIDSLANKVHLLEAASHTSAIVLSSMGAALRTDPSHIRTARLEKTKGCALARQVRQRVRGRLARQDILCVFSDEAPLIDECCSHSVQINGSMVQITGIFGFTLAALAVNELRVRSLTKKNER